MENSKIVDESDEKQVINEILILKKIRHPNVIQLYDVDNKFKSDMKQFEMIDIAKAILDKHISKRQFITT